MTLFIPEIKPSAILSKCGKYRYRLDLFWDPAVPQICFCMLNPSTADAEKDDPTIRKCMGFARKWGAGGIRVVNLFALRATDPRELLKHPAPIAEPDEAHPLYENMNDAYIIFGSDGLRLVAAWGRGGKIHGRAKAVMQLLGRNRRVECLGITKDGHPWHPLYLPGDTVPVPFNGVPTHA